MGPEVLQNEILDPGIEGQWVIHLYILQVFARMEEPFPPSDRNRSLRGTVIGFVASPEHQWIHNIFLQKDFKGNSWSKCATSKYFGKHSDSVRNGIYLTDAQWKENGI